MPGYEVIGSEERLEVEDVFNRGGILFRHGFDALRNNCYKVMQFEKEFSDYMGVNHALAVTSGTAALRVGLAALNIGPGDEVITQSFTFVATVEAIIEARATPVCTNIDDTLNMDPVDLERLITPKTKAVIVVHMLGTPARLREIKDVCDQHGLYLIEDTAWGCGGNLDGIPLGTWGDVGTYSFDFAKTMTTGEGGMVVFRDTAVFQRAAAWHDHGHENNPLVPRWEDTRSSSGFNYRMMELQGAIGLAQLRKLSSIVSKQRENKAAIWSALADLTDLQPRAAPDGAFDTADALIFMAKNSDIALKIRAGLVDEGLATKILPEAYSWHFAGTWTHMPELIAAHGGKLTKSFEVSHSILSRAVSLPVGVSLPTNAPARIRTVIERILM